MSSNGDRAATGRPGRTERRASERIRVALPVRVRTPLIERDLLTHDINRDGIFVRTDSPARLQELVEVAVDLGAGQKPVVAVGVVRHIVEADDTSSSASPPGMGLHFFGIHPEQRKRWVRFVDGLTPGHLAAATPIAPSPPAEPIRRRHRRVPSGATVRLVQPPLRFELEVLNISEGGALLGAPDSARNALPQAGEVRIEVRHWTEREALPLRCRVVRSDEGDAAEAAPTLAVAFTYGDPSERMRLRAMLRADLPAEHQAGDFLVEEDDDRGSDR